MINLLYPRIKFIRKYIYGRIEEPPPFLNRLKIMAETSQTFYNVNVQTVLTPNKSGKTVGKLKLYEKYTMSEYCHVKNIINHIFIFRDVFVIFKFNTSSKCRFITSTWKLIRL